MQPWRGPYARNGNWPMPNWKSANSVTTTGSDFRTSRVFLDPPTVQAALAAAPDAERILTYLVNEIRNGTHATPYSMVAAVSGPLLPADMTDGQILVNQWLADDLTPSPGTPCR